VHAEAEVHDTLARPLPSLPGLRVVWMVHVVPFQRSASVATALPMAVHEDAEVHDTPETETFSAWLGTGMDCEVQVVPFQRSASAPKASLCRKYEPTAVHTDADVHDTACRTALPFGPTVGWTAQTLPFSLGFPPPHPARLLVHGLMTLGSSPCAASAVTICSLKQASRWWA
jgi:hypothetical protein